MQLIGKRGEEKKKEEALIITNYLLLWGRGEIGVSKGKHGAFRQNCGKVIRLRRNTTGNKRGGWATEIKTKSRNLPFIWRKS